MRAIRLLFLMVMVAALAVLPFEAGAQVGGVSISTPSPAVAVETDQITAFSLDVTAPRTVGLVALTVIGFAVAYISLIDRRSERKGGDAAGGSSSRGQGTKYAGRVVKNRQQGTTHEEVTGNAYEVRPLL